MWLGLGAALGQLRGQGPPRSHLHMCAPADKHPNRHPDCQDLPRHATFRQALLLHPLLQTLLQLATHATDCTASVTRTARPWLHGIVFLAMCESLQLQAVFKTCLFVSGWQLPSSHVQQDPFTHALLKCWRVGTRA